MVALPLAAIGAGDLGDFGRTWSESGSALQWFLDDDATIDEHVTSFANQATLYVRVETNDSFTVDSTQSKIATARADDSNETDNFPTWSEVSPGIWEASITLAEGLNDSRAYVEVLLKDAAGTMVFKAGSSLNVGSPAGIADTHIWYRDTALTLLSDPALFARGATYVLQFVGPGSWNADQPVGLEVAWSAYDGSEQTVVDDQNMTQVGATEFFHYSVVVPSTGIGAQEWVTIEVEGSAENGAEGEVTGWDNAYMVDKVWTGETSSSWNMAANWLPGGVPGPTDVVAIPSSTYYRDAPELDVTTTVARLILKPGGTLNGSSSGTFTLSVTGDMLIHGTLDFSTHDESVDVNGTTDVDGTLNLGTGMFDADGTYNATGGNTTFSGAGVLRLSSEVTSLGTLTEGTGTVEVDDQSSGRAVPAETYYNLEIDGSTMTHTAGGDITVGNEFRITSGTFVAPSGSLTVAGDFVNNGSFTHNTGTVVLDGSGASTITGSTTFNHFICTTGGKQINFTSGTTQTIDGALVLTGVCGSDILLRSTVGGGKWNLAFPNGAQTVANLDVSDSDANANTVTVSVGTDSGNNNTNWIFLAPGSTAPTGLLAEDATNPASVDDATPEFKATFDDPCGAIADLVRIQVNVASDFSGTMMWDTGAAGTSMTDTPDGTQSPNIQYAGSDLSWGQTYYWRIKLWDTLGNEGSWSAGNASFTMTTPSLTLPNGPGDSWQMFSVPSGVSVSTAALSGISGAFYYWDELARTWVTTATLQPGRGHFVYAGPNGVTLNSGTARSGDYTIASLTSNNLSGPTGMESETNALAGWHLIGNIYNGAISWDDAVETAPLANNIETTYWRWDGTQYLSYNATTNTGPAGGSIPKFQAVWVHVPSLGSTGDLTLKEPGTWGEPSVPTPYDANWWLLQIAATSGSGSVRDDYNWVGVHALAEDAWDKRDASDAGSLAWPYVIVDFDHTDWGTTSGRYSQDVRKTPYNAGDTVTWQMSVRVGSTPQAVTLSWPNLAAMPGEWTYTLDDGVTFVDLATVSDYSYSQSVTEKFWTLTATRQVTGIASLEVRLGTQTSSPQSISSGDTVTMLQVELIAAAEDIQVDPLGAFDIGSAQVGAIRTHHDLDANGKLDPTDPEIVGLLVAVGTSEFILVVFENITGTAGAGTRAVLEPWGVTGIGMTTSTSVVGNGALVEGATMTIGPLPEPDAPTRVSGGGGGGGGGLSCSASCKGPQGPESPLTLAILLLLVALPAVWLARGA